jgi:hypothetical protein
VETKLIVRLDLNFLDLVRAGDIVRAVQVCFKIQGARVSTVVLWLIHAPRTKRWKRKKAKKRMRE